MVTIDIILAVSRAASGKTSLSLGPKNETAVAVASSGFLLTASLLWPWFAPTW